MSVWDTFSASFHLVQEKLEQVLEDTSSTEREEEKEVRRRVKIATFTCIL